MTKIMLKSCIVSCTLLFTACGSNDSKTTTTSNASVTNNDDDQVVNSHESVTNNGDQVVNSNEPATNDGDQVANSNEPMTNNAEQSIIKSEIIAIDNSANEVKSEFNGYKVVVYTDTELEKTPSSASKAIYGNINGKSTTSLLSISDNYSDGAVFWVKVFDGDKVVGQSDKVVLDGESVEFEDIELIGGYDE